ncbi:uncharacterized protein YdiU (UPF0061 family) [Neisseria sp. HSC-16F19]|nr:YdiU family protein [Neisseria sp. HSC-16F19]MCP2041341.1 uncharacterized protein YdiU (UPF0061 family) [Neisseria sp. HSC-16F19]
MALNLHTPDIARLDFLCERVRPQALSAPQLALVSDTLAVEMGIDPDTLRQADTVRQLAGSAGHYDPAPIATVYSGHQFGVYVPQLGDGRTMLLGDWRSADGRRWEIQLKGSGKTPFSRFADGRAVLRSSLREYLASEAMHALGIPTTRALALTASPDPVYREQPETAAVVTRVAESFLRFGHFEYFYRRSQHEYLAPLADHVIAHHYPECAAAERPYAALFAAVSARTARLMAQWQSVGFCHGVMNTDNMSLLGLTIDYGPYGFLDCYDRAHICNHSDHGGRYAYQEQPYIAQWNLLQLASAFLPLAEEGELVTILNNYGSHYRQAYLDLMRAKLGLHSAQDGDLTLISELFDLMQAQQADFTLTFRALADVDAHSDRLPESLAARFAEDIGGIHAWCSRYRARLQAEQSHQSERHTQMKQTNPLYVPRNHLLEAAIAAAQNGDFSVAERLQTCLRDPFTERAEYADLAAAAPAWAKEICVSCSS